MVNGISIVHSHPYKSVKHTHTTGEFELLEMLNHFISTDAPIPVFTLVFIALFSFVLLPKSVTQSLKEISLGLVQPRAPPLLILK